MFSRLLRKHAYKLAFAWAAVIFALCSTPGRFIPTTSWLELLSADKWVHASVFFILSLLLFAGVITNAQRPTAIYYWLIVAIAYGGLLEILQAKVFSERSADWQDFVANSFGCLMALVFHKRLLKPLRNNSF
jgi:hypothetical protein